MSVFKPSVPMYPVQTKIWGWTQHIFLSKKCEIARAHIVTNGYCSRHHHENKTNRFHIINGILEIVVFRNDKEERVTLHPGMTLDVPSKIQHKMICHSTCDFIEMYWPDENKKLRANDIVRVDEGGILPIKPSNITNLTWMPVGDSIRMEPSFLDNFYENYPH